MEAVKKEEASLQALVKTIPVLKHPKKKVWASEDDEDLPPVERKTRPWSTLDIMEAVLSYVPKGPHGEPLGVPGKEQAKIFKILNKIEDLDPNAQTLELTEKEFSFLQKKTKGFPWGIVDKMIVQFEQSLGIDHDDN